MILESEIILPKTTVVINNPAPKILPTANKIPSPDETNAVITSGAPLAKAISVTLKHRE